MAYLFVNASCKLYASVLLGKKVSLAGFEICREKGVWFFALSMKGLPTA
jgi:hypothetical protein